MSEGNPRAVTSFVTLVVQMGKGFVWGGDGPVVLAKDLLCTPSQAYRCLSVFIGGSEKVQDFPGFSGKGRRQRHFTGDLIVDGLVH